MLLFWKPWVILLFPQNMETLQATRLALPRSPGSTAFLYTEDVVFACSTGTNRVAVPDEKISFNSPGGKVGTLEQELLHFVTITACNSDEMNTVVSE